jgi:hypothetical protein
LLKGRTLGMHTNVAACADIMSSQIGRNIAERQLRSRGWSHAGTQQASMEATCLGALGLAREDKTSAAMAIRFLLDSQRADRGWPAFTGDPEPSWTTALVLSTLTVANDVSDARGRALKWLLSERGKEGNWFWRWKFKTADREVRFNPDKYGWP